MEEHDTRAKAKDFAEYITPKELRELMVREVKGDKLKVLEPAIGSGQLLFELSDRINCIDGFDVNPDSIELVRRNFKDRINARCQDFITTDLNQEYDVAIANYPFSLKPTQEQKEYISQDTFLKQFYYKGKKDSNLFNMDTIQVKPDDVKGKLDYVFILKSFNLAKEGVYLAFPGVSYRQEEEKFRKYLIRNKFIKKFGLINNCKFEHTSISILYLHLTKQPNQQTTAFNLDLRTGKLLEEVATFENNQFTYPKEEIKREKVDGIQLEKDMRRQAVTNLKKQLDWMNSIYRIDKELQDNLPTVEQFKKEIINAVNEHGKTR